MAATLDPTNSSAFQYNKVNADFISKICEPLFINFNITSFVYSHFFNNGTYLDLSTNIEWQQHYMEHFAAHPFIIDYVRNISQERVEYVLWNNDVGLPRDKMLTQFIADSCAFDIWHGFSIYKHHKDSLEAWHFGTTKENYKIVNFYLNHLDILRHFITYFQDKAASLINTIDVSKLISFKEHTPLVKPEETLHSVDYVKEYMGQATIKRYSFNTSHGTVYISRREAECIQHLAASKTLKETARLMNLSPRTVEGYITNAKRKLGCYTRSKLVESFSHSHDKSVYTLF